MEIGSVYTESVIVGERQRKLDERKVAALAESIGQIGLQQPISIWHEDDEHLHLVAGRHRLAAAVKLGWEEIPCIFVSLSERRRRIWEIDENLYRNELSTEEMREHLRERKRLWEEEQKESGKSLPTFEKPLSGRGHRGFAAETAESTGLSKRRINQLLSEPTVKERAVPVDRSEPDMAVVAQRLAAAYTIGQLQELIDHLADNIKARMAA